MSRAFTYYVIFQYGRWEKYMTEKRESWEENDWTPKREDIGLTTRRMNTRWRANLISHLCPDHITSNPWSSVLSGSQTHPNFVLVREPD